jgi:hypothetical protein
MLVRTTLSLIRYEIEVEMFVKIVVIAEATLLVAAIAANAIRR